MIRTSIYLGVGKRFCLYQNRYACHLTSNLFDFTRGFKSLYNFNAKFGTMGRNLAAFDFDHTIVDGNSDIVVRNLLAKELIPDSVKRLYKNDGWTAYMQGVFELLHVNDFNEDDVVQALVGIPATAGLPELIKELHENLNYDVIIISDSNSYLIDTWLNEHGLAQYILKVFTNPAKFVKGVLRIEMYHLQLDCKLSTKNLCKGKILTDFIEESKLENVLYDKVLYVGDGTNDFCPILRLNATDLACVRDNYSCQQMVSTVKEGKPLPVTGLTYEIKADVIVWKTGNEILERLRLE